MPRIILESGPLRGEAVSLPHGRPVAIGRDNSSFLRLHDERVSRLHIVIEGRGAEFVILDQGSRNGTLVNGKRVTRQTLHSGDMIQIGRTFLSFFNEQEDPLVGGVLAGYRVDRRVGRGGMGTVYQAHQVSLERTVALKILARDLTEDEDFIRRFLDEARSAAKLNHPNIVQVYDAGQHEGLYYLSMEFIPGGSLQALLEKEGRLMPERVVPMAIDAAEALVWGEHKGIIHRDIKPDNLLLDAKHTVKLADFGLAADRQKSKTLYQGGKVIGTPHFMAPEQAMGQVVDHRADIYGLGSTLYAALSGSPPFDGETPVEIMMKKLKESPPLLTKAAPEVPADLAQVIEKMMATEPEKRFQTAREVQAALRQVLEDLRNPLPPKGDRRPFWKLF